MRKLSLFVLLSAVMASLPSMQAAAADPQRALPIASSSNWHTDVILSALPNASAPVAVQIQNSGFGYDGATTTIVPGGSAIVRDVSLPGGFGILPAPAGVTSMSLLQFDDGRTRQSFAVVPIGAVAPDHSARLGPIMNDGATGTWLNVFSDVPASLTITLYDGHAGFVGREFVTVTPPVTQYRVQATLPIGSMAISSGFYGFTSGGPPVYCFASVSDAAGGNARVLPCE